MDRFNSNEDVEETPLRIAKDIIYSDTTLEEKVKLIESALIKAENLPISDVVGRSEQLVCDCGNPNLTWYGYGDDKTYFCFECKKEVTN
jgi:hypothetical protein